jgi:hypothetical protein
MEELAHLMAEYSLSYTHKAPDHNTDAGRLMLALEDVHGRDPSKQAQYILSRLQMTPTRKNGVPAPTAAYMILYDTMAISSHTTALYDPGMAAHAMLQLAATRASAPEATKAALLLAMAARVDSMVEIELLKARQEASGEAAPPPVRRAFNQYEEDMVYQPQELDKTPFWFVRMWTTKSTLGKWHVRDGHAKFWTHFAERRLAQLPQTLRHPPLRPSDAAPADEHEQYAAFILGNFCVHSDALALLAGDTLWAKLLSWEGGQATGPFDAAGRVICANIQAVQLAKRVTASKQRVRRDQMRRALEELHVPSPHSDSEDEQEEGEDEEGGFEGTRARTRTDPDPRLLPATSDTGLDEQATLAMFNEQPDDSHDSALQYANKARRTAGSLASINALLTIRNKTSLAKHTLNHADQHFNKPALKQAAKDIETAAKLADLKLRMTTSQESLATLRALQQQHQQRQQQQQQPPKPGAQPLEPGEPTPQQGPAILLATAAEQSGSAGGATAGQAASREALLLELMETTARDLQLDEQQRRPFMLIAAKIATYPLPEERQLMGAAAAPTATPATAAASGSGSRGDGGSSNSGGGGGSGSDGHSDSSRDRRPLPQLLILIIGEPGTGKTQVALAVMLFAKRCGQVDAVVLCSYMWRSSLNMQQYGFRAESSSRLHGLDPVHGNQLTRRGRGRPRLAEPTNCTLWEEFFVSPGEHYYAAHVAALEARSGPSATGQADSAAAARAASRAGQPFGGLDVIKIGDTFQHGPVGAAPAVWFMADKSATERALAVRGKLATVAASDAEDGQKHSRLSPTTVAGALAGQQLLRRTQLVFNLTIPHRFQTIDPATGQAFLSKGANQLLRYAKMLAHGTATKDEVAELVDALQRKGIDDVQEWSARPENKDRNPHVLTLRNRQRLAINPILALQHAVNLGKTIYVWKARHRRADGGPPPAELRVTLNETCDDKHHDNLEPESCFFEGIEYVFHKTELEEAGWVHNGTGFGEGIVLEAEDAADEALERQEAARAGGKSTSVVRMLKHPPVALFVRPALLPQSMKLPPAASGAPPNCVLVTSSRHVTTYTLTHPQILIGTNKLVRDVAILRENIPVGMGYASTDFFYQGVSLKGACCLLDLARTKDGFMRRSSAYVAATRPATFDDVLHFGRMYDDSISGDRQRAIDSFHKNVTRPEPDRMAFYQELLVRAARTDLIYGQLLAAYRRGDSETARKLLALPYDIPHNWQAALAAADADDPKARRRQRPPTPPRRAPPRRANRGAPRAQHASATRPLRPATRTGRRRCKTC